MNQTFFVVRSVKNSTLAKTFTKIFNATVQIYFSTKTDFLLVYGIMCRNMIKLRYVVCSISSIISM